MNTRPCSGCPGVVEDDNRSSGTRFCSMACRASDALVTEAERVNAAIGQTPMGSQWLAAAQAVADALTPAIAAREEVRSLAESVGIDWQALSNTSTAAASTTKPRRRRRTASPPRTGAGTGYPGYRR